jgi:hypothetical protein
MLAIGYLRFSELNSSQPKLGDDRSKASPFGSGPPVESPFPYPQPTLDLPSAEGQRKITPPCSTLLPSQQRLKVHMIISILQVKAKRPLWFVSPQWSWSGLEIWCQEVNIIQSVRVSEGQVDQIECQFMSIVRWHWITEFYISHEPMSNLVSFIARLLSIFNWSSWYPALGSVSFPETRFRDLKGKMALKPNREATIPRGSESWDLGVSRSLVKLSKPPKLPRENHYAFESSTTQESISSLYTSASPMTQAGHVR